MAQGYIYYTLTWCGVGELIFMVSQFHFFFILGFYPYSQLKPCTLLGYEFSKIVYYFFSSTLAAF